MNPDYIQPMVTILSLLAAVLAWIAKLRWSKEYAAAKDEIIRSKEEQLKTIEKEKDQIIAAKTGQLQIAQRQIEFLSEQTPVKLREYFDTVRASLEEYIEKLQHEINKLKYELSKEKSIGGPFGGGMSPLSLPGRQKLPGYQEDTDNMNVKLRSYTTDSLAKLIRDTENIKEKVHIYNEYIPKIFHDE